MQRNQWRITIQTAHENNAVIHNVAHGSMKLQRYNTIANAARKLQQRANDFASLECATLTRDEIEVYAYASHEDDAD